MLSMIVTVDIHVDELPLLSITVNVTGLAPRFEHVNVFGETERPANPHASDDPLLINATVAEALPEASKAIVGLLQSAVGDSTSVTVTLNEHVAV
jgi:hypothetical protein